MIAAAPKAFALNEDPGRLMGHHTDSDLHEIGGNLHDFLVANQEGNEKIEQKTLHEIVSEEKRNLDESGFEVGDKPSERFQGLVRHKEKSSKSVTYDISDASGTDAPNHSTTLDARRPSSAILRARRKQHEQRENHLRGLMNTVSSSYSGDEHSVSSHCTFNSVETSLLSHGRNLSKGKDIKWEKLNVQISFGLLTTPREAPTEGSFSSIDDMEENIMLRSIMSKMKTLSKAMIEQNTGNILMKCQDPFVTSIQRDGEYQRTTAERKRLLSYSSSHMYCRSFYFPATRCCEEYYSDHCTHETYRCSRRIKQHIQNSCKGNGSSSSHRRYP
jgi:hypothetical protein